MTIERAGTESEARIPAQGEEGSGYLAENEDFLVQVPVDSVCVVDEVAQQLAVLRGGHDEDLFGPVVQDELVRELAVLKISLMAPVGVHVGDLPNPYGLLGVLHAQGLSPYVGCMDERFLTRWTPS